MAELAAAAAPALLLLGQRLLVLLQAESVEGVAADLAEHKLQSTVESDTPLQREGRKQGAWDPPLQPQYPNPI